MGVNTESAHRCVVADCIQGGSRKMKPSTSVNHQSKKYSRLYSVFTSSYLTSKHLFNASHSTANAYQTNNIWNNVTVNDSGSHAKLNVFLRIKKCSNWLHPHVTRNGTREFHAVGGTGNHIYITILCFKIVMSGRLTFSQRSIFVWNLLRDDFYL